jgi:excisionase family DNA binding protein
MANAPTPQSQNIDRVLEDLRALDRLGPAEIARVLPELERVSARLWLSMLTLNQGPPIVPAEPASQLLTVKQAAEHLGFSRGHVYELVRSGRLRAIRHGRTIRITREALAEWQATHEGGPLDGSLSSSGESSLHDELHGYVDSPPNRPDRAPGRRSQSAMNRGR